ncbi:MAG: hypothetical protein PHY93_02620 [Bacteriovorax sp.]|nr:hypothetical protein [Bacteriovorax sp.]
MRPFLLLVQILFFSLLTMGAKSHIASNSAIKNKDIKILDLKLKKELSDKKLPPLKKYTFAILAARELKQLYYSDKALEFYQLAREMKVDENKAEITQAFSKKHLFSPSSVFFYEVNLKALLKNKSYERAILSLNPEKLNEPENAHYKIIYDLLNVKIKRRAVKKLYCFDDYQKDPEDYQYSNLLCDLLIDYLRDGKLGNDHIKVVEEYFFKHDLKEIYLLQVAKDLKTSP